MVKCLVKIKTRVSVHLWLINHCCRAVRVRVLALGPRLLSRALGILPLLPAGPGDRPEPGNAVPRGLGSSGVSSRDWGSRGQLVTPAREQVGCRNVGCRNVGCRKCVAGSGLEVSEAVWAQVALTTEQLCCWGWTQISRIFQLLLSVLWKQMAAGFGSEGPAVLSLG